MYRITTLAVCLLAAMLIASAAMADTVSLTQGVSGYAGMSQGEIRGYIWGGGGYTTPGYYIPGRLYFHRSWTPGYKARVFLKWDLSGVVPDGYAITGAQLGMTRMWTAQDLSEGADPTINIHKALQPWTEGEVTWMNWSNGGRLMDPDDPNGVAVIQDPNPAYAGELMGTIANTCDDLQTEEYYRRYNVDLDAAAVQSWIDDPSSNYGMFLKFAVDDTVNHTSVFYSTKTDSTLAYRPTLTLTYAPVPEPSAMLALGSGLVGLVGFGIRRRR